MAREDLRADIKLSPREREIAIQAMGARVSGEPAEAALQLLHGIAVLDGQHIPAVAWPNGLSLGEKAAWHMEQAAALKKREAWINEFRIATAIRQASVSDSTPPCPDKQYQPEPSDKHSLSVQPGKAPRAERIEAVPLRATEPGRGPNGISE